MVATEIFLIAAGVICVVVSVVMSFGDDKENVESSAKAELTQAQLDMVKHQVDEVIKQQISGLSEKTEAALDKISNTKILEMNEYAESVLGEINRNHNEAVFLYDMLNEKSKEVKTLIMQKSRLNRLVEELLICLIMQSCQKNMNRTAQVMGKNRHMNRRLSLVKIQRI